MSRDFRADLHTLKDNILKQSSLVEKIYRDSMLGFLNKDKLMASAVVQLDQTIDEKEVEIEEECLRLLTLHQPVAKDLRFIITCLKINSALERVADLSVNIAFCTKSLVKRGYPLEPVTLEPLFKETLKMYRDAVTSLIDLDSSLAYQVCIADDSVDHLNSEMFKTVVSELDQQTQHSRSLLQLLLASRHLERIADYATNIAEDVIYLVDAKVVRHLPKEPLHL